MITECPLASLLERSAAALRPKGTPVSVLAVCEELGVRVVHSGTTKRALLVASPSGPEIRLPPRDGDLRMLSPFERFRVAHELGHHVLAAQRVSPLGTSEYWQHENLCDYFARLLLIPSSLCADPPRSVRGIWAEVSRVSRLTDSPEDAVKSRVTDIAPYLVFLVLRREHETLDWRVVASTFPDKKEIGRIVRADNTLYAVLGRILQGTEGHLSPRLLSVFPTLHSSVGATFRAQHDVIELAVQLPPVEANAPLRQ